MKKVQVTLIMLTLLCTSIVFAQGFQGIATYKTKRSVDIKLDSTQINSEMQKQMKEMLKKRFQKTFKLSFNQEASIYKEEESLAPPQVGGSNMQVMVVGPNSGSDILYKNTKSNTFTNQKDVLGKIFLVKDKLEPIEWSLGSDTKYIGEYICYKATFTREIQISSNVRLRGASTTNNEATEPVTETQTVTAWYTTEIPVNNGPENYQGLPGLILEVTAGKQQIVCSKIVLNPATKIDIKEPTKGKVINQAEYDEIMEKKRKEMMERYAPKNGRKGGESIQIRVGG